MQGALILSGGVGLSVIAAHVIWYTRWRSGFFAWQRVNRQTNTVAIGYRQWKEEVLNEPSFSDYAAANRLTHPLVDAYEHIKSEIQNDQDCLCVFIPVLIVAAIITGCYFVFRN